MEEEWVVEDREDRFIRLPEVKSMVCLSGATIYNYVRVGKFPKPVKLSRNMSLWSAKQVQGWIGERLKATAEAKT
jgi:prophage regulatory protein